MKIIIRMVVVIAILALIVLGSGWALMPLLMPPQGLHNGSHADLIRDRYPHRLVDPSSLNMSDADVGFEWVFVEARTRAFAVLGSLSVCLILGTATRIWIKKRKSANQALHGTAGGRADASPSVP